MGLELALKKVREGGRYSILERRGGTVQLFDTSKTVIRVK